MYKKEILESFVKRELSNVIRDPSELYQKGNVLNKLITGLRYNNLEIPKNYAVIVRVFNNGNKLKPVNVQVFKKDYTLGYRDIVFYNKINDFNFKKDNIVVFRND